MQAGMAHSWLIAIYLKWYIPFCIDLSGATNLSVEDII